MSVTKSITQEQWEQVDRMFDGNTPEYLNIVSRNLIKITISDWQGSKEIFVKPKNIIDYYHTNAQNTTSGLRTLAGHSGDWRPINDMTNLLFEIFKIINLQALERENKKYGMELKPQ